MGRFRLWLNSISVKLMSGLIFTIGPLLIVLLFVNHYSTDIVRNQVAKSNKNLLSLYLNQIDGNLQEVDNYIINLSQTNMDLLELDTSQTANVNNYNKAKLRLFQLINNDVGYYKAVDTFFIYSEANQDLLMTQSFGGGYEDRERVAKQITAMVNDKAVKLDVKRWNVWSADGHYYVYHAIKSGNVYVGAWVDATKLMIPLQLINLGPAGTALLTTDSMEPMSQSAMIAGQGIRFALSQDPYIISGSHSQYLVIGAPSQKGSFNLFAVIPQATVLEELPYLQRISTLISLVAIATLVIFVIFMRRVFVKPIYRIIRAMRKLGDGKWDSRIEQYPTSTEFAVMNEAYNGMITEIRQLKINVYEEQLHHQKAELKHLQLQINPHFFLNSLNIIYNLATVKDFALIQEMARCLVEYFRFMFRSNSYLVALKDELKHTKNYLRIQELRFPGILSHRVEAQEDALRFDVPPLMIQTLVENSIKHAVNMDRPIEIDVHVATEMDENDNIAWIAIRIEDTGDGFPEEVLERLRNKLEPTSEEGEHIGIWNINRRLRLLYGDQAELDFYNTEESGAGVCIRLPVNTDGRR